MQIPPHPPVEAQALAARGRRERVRAHHAAAHPDTAWIVPAGVRIPIPGTDQFHAARIHDNHRYLAGVGCEGACLLHHDGTWVLFVPVPDVDDRVWHGPPPDLSVLAARSGIEDIRPAQELEAACLALGSTPVAWAGQRDLAERPASYGMSPSAVASLAVDAEASRALTGAIEAARLRKDEVELAWMRAAAVATAVGHARGVSACRPGIAESVLAAEIEAGFRAGGADGPAYDTIVAAGTNAAVLHAAPGRRAVEAEDLVLVDAGAEVEGYDADVTRTFPASGRLTGRAADLHAVVLAAQQAAIARVTPGVETKDLHLDTCLDLAQGLCDLGLLRGRAEDAVASHALALFFPHGIGHLIGLGTHDVGGRLPDRPPADVPGLRYLRMDRPLEAGMVITVEPGLYFIPALLDDPIHRQMHADHVDFEAVEAWRPLGGVRIEDNVHVADAGPEVLTAAIP